MRLCYDHLTYFNCIKFIQNLCMNKFKNEQNDFFKKFVKEKIKFKTHFLDHS